MKRRGTVAGMSAVLCLAGIAAAGPYDLWTGETIDTGGPAGDTGYYNSLAVLPSGDPAVAFSQFQWTPDPWQLTGGQLKYAQRSGAAWQVEVLEVGGFYADLQVCPSTGQAALVHTDGMHALRYLWNDGTSWHGETAQQGSGMDIFTDCKLRYLPDGSPAISYSEGFVTGEVRYAHRSASGAWNVEVIDAVGPLPTPGHTSLAILPSGEPAVAYNDIPGTRLCYALRNGVTSAWDIFVIDEPQLGWENVGISVDMQVLPTGQPAVAYYYIVQGGVQEGLKYAWFDGAQWHKEVVDDTLEIAGDNASLAILPSGEPVIAYSDGMDHLKFAWRDSGDWYTQVVATGVGTSDWRFAFWNDLAVMPSGLPAISYYDLVGEINGDMSVAFCVPEPAALGLLALGGLALIRRRR